MSRREFMAAGARGLAAATLFSAASSLHAQGDAGEKIIRVGFIGVGARGSGLLAILLGMDGAEITALCDINEGNLNSAAALVEQTAGKAPAKFTGDPHAYQKLLARDDVDAVIIATPIMWHLEMAIDALKAGKHVASEVTAGFVLDKLWELVRTKQQTGRRYMMMENCTFYGELMMIQGMLDQGMFGDPHFTECSYIHDCKFIDFNPDGTLTWRGEMARDYHGNTYSTHALGPVCKWLGINDGDRMVSLTSTATGARCLHEYAVRKYGPNSPQAKIVFRDEDFVATTIKTAKGRIIQLDFDLYSPRPASNYWAIQGTRGVFDTRQGLYFEKEGAEERWTKSDEFWNEYQPPLWQRYGEYAAKTSHGGSDWFVLRHFLRMVREDREPWVDVYDAAAWSVMQHCTALSLANGNAPVEIPDFTEGRWETPDWRKDNLKPAV